MDARRQLVNEQPSRRHVSQVTGDASKEIADMHFDSVSDDNLSSVISKVIDNADKKRKDREKAELEARSMATPNLLQTLHIVLHVVVQGLQLYRTWPAL